MISVRSRGHNYRGPSPTMWGGSVPIMFAAVCTCGWRSDINRVTRQQARADWLLHRERAAADMREDIEWDRDTGADL